VDTLIDGLSNIDVITAIARRHIAMWSILKSRVVIINRMGGLKRRATAAKLEVLLLLEVDVPETS
jgi:hypothetical protein